MATDTMPFLQAASCAGVLHAAFGLAALLGGVASAAPPIYVCRHTRQSPAIDGAIADACWMAAECVAVACRVGEGAGTAQASFRLLWDDEHLYVAAEVRDATPCTVGTHRDDPVWDGDCLELYVNPDDRSGEYYELDFNPTGTIWDSLWRRLGDGKSRTVRSWTAPSLECRTRPNAGGWTLESRIRLDEFVGARHLPPRHGDEWRGSVNYLDAPPNRVPLTIFAWSPTDLIEDTRHFGIIRFVRDAATPTAVQPPAGWEPFGATGATGTGTNAAGEACLRVAATPGFAGFHRVFPHRSGATLYRLTGAVRTDLPPLIKAQIGIDYLGADGAFIRQATTRASFDVHLRWGLSSVEGRAPWTPCVAYAYDVPPETESLRVWCGVNPWETPNEGGVAWFDDVRLEAVEPNPAWPLGFPPCEWRPEAGAAPEAGPANAQAPCRVAPLNYLRYTLPAMPLPPEDSGPALRAVSFPGDSEPVSFAIRSTGAMTGVRVAVSDLTSVDPGRAAIPAARIDVAQVRYVYKKRDLLSSEYLLSPNHLEPCGAVDIPADTTRQFWLTVRVPEDAAAGVYEGAVTVWSPGATTTTLPLRLEVLPIRIPPSRGTWIGMYYDPTPRGTLDSIVEDFRDMRAHGMTTVFMFNGGITIPVEAGDGHRPKIVWGNGNQLEAICEAFLRAGFSEPLLLYSPASLSRSAEEHGGPMGTTAFARVYADLWSQVQSERERRGWPAFCVAPYDEGYPYPFARTRFAVTRALGPVLESLGIPIATHSFNHPIPAAADFEREFYPAIDAILLTFCHPPITLSAVHGDFADWPTYLNQAHHDGKKVLYYNPDTTGVHPEATRFAYGVGLWARRADGVMNWHYREDHAEGGYGIKGPRGRRTQGYAVMNFVFPAHEDFAGGPSIGWEATREGAQDYALLRLLDGLIAAAEKSPDAARRAAATRARLEVDAFVSRVTFDTIDMQGGLSLPARWERESFDDTGRRIVGGEFKIQNGFSLDDYDQLRRIVCGHVLALTP